MSKPLTGWIEIGLMQEPDKGSEFFYFDKLNRQFFSVLSSDYLLFDSGFERTNVPTEYTESSMAELLDKLKRMAANDATIVAIPRMGQTIVDFEVSVNKFLSNNSIALESATLWVPESLA